MKIFCPNCEKETECTFQCEVYCCNECNEDYATYEKQKPNNKLLADCKQFADRHRSKNKTSGPNWSTIIRFAPLYDEAVRLQQNVDELECKLKSKEIVIEAKQQIINKLAAKMLATSQDMVAQSNNITLEEYIKYLELKEQVYVNKNKIEYGCKDPE